jgi:hypothetical protein
MPQLFHPAMNVVAKASVFGVLFALAFLFWVLGVVYRSSYVSGADVVREQPVQFSHAHHVGALGIDCRYCHSSVETSAFAGYPSTQTCMNCHSEVWSRAPMLAAVRESWRENRPIAWNRVHDLADFAYFNHAIHVAKGVGCAECHGRVDDMPLMWQTQSLYMEWCLDCHRKPEASLRPREAVFRMDWTRPANDPELGARLARDYGVASKTDCNSCHR